MARQDNTALHLGSDMGIKARLLPGLVIVAMAGDAVLAEIPLDPVDERQVRVAAYGRERPPADPEALAD
jgi:hypothetical protein